MESTFQSVIQKNVRLQGAMGSSRSRLLVLHCAPGLALEARDPHPDKQGYTCYASKGTGAQPPFGGTVLRTYPVRNCPSFPRLVAHMSKTYHH